MPFIGPLIWEAAYWLAENWAMAALFVASTAYSVISSNNAKKKLAQALASLQANAGQRITLQFDSVSPTQWIYGRTRVAGTLAFANSTGTSGTINGVYLNMIALIADHTIDGYETIYLNEDFACGNTGVVDAKFLSGSVYYFKVWMKDGTQTAPDSDMVIRFGNDIDSTYKYTGISYIGSSYTYDQYNNVWPSGVPTLTAIVRGKNDILDPRTSTTGYTDNPALCIRDVLTNFIGVDQSAINDSTFIHAANVCDEDVNLAANYTVSGCSTQASSSFVVTPDTAGLLDNIYVGLTVRGTYIPSGTVVTAVHDIPGDRYFMTSVTSSINSSVFTAIFGGTSAPERRYRCWGTFSSDKSPNEILSSMLSSCNGSLVFSNGQFSLLVGEWREPVVTLTQDDLLDVLNVAINISQKDSYNSITSQWISPDAFYHAATSAPYSSSLFIDQDGGYKSNLEIDLAWTPSPTMVQRLQKQALYYNRFEMVLQLKCKLTAYRLNVGDTFYLNYPRLGFSNKLFEVQKMDTDFSAGIVSMDVKATDPAIYDWNTTDEQIYKRNKNSTLPDPWIVNPPTNLAVEAGTADLIRLADSTIIVRAKLSWTAPTTLVSGYQVDFRPSHTGSYSASLWTTAAMINNNAVTNFVYIPLDTQEINYDFRIRSISFLGRYSDWVELDNQYVAGKSQPPRAPESMSVIPGYDGAQINWINDPIDVDYSYTSLFVTSSMSNTGSEYARISGQTIFLSLPTSASASVYAQNIDTTGNTSSFNYVRFATLAAPSSSIGPAGPGAEYIVMTQDSITIPCSSSGDPLPGYLGPSGSARTTVYVYRGTTQLTASNNPTPDSASFYIVNSFAVTGSASFIKQGNDTVYVDTISSSNAFARLEVHTTGSAYYKFISVNKSISGGTGSMGNTLERRYTASLALPATPTGDNPAGWTIQPPPITINMALWFSEAYRMAVGIITGSWTTPVRLYGNVNWNQSTPPSNPVAGDLWTDSSTGKSYWYNGTSWIYYRDNAIDVITGSLINQSASIAAISSSQQAMSASNALASASLSQAKIDLTNNSASFAYLINANSASLATSITAVSSSNVANSSSLASSITTVSGTVIANSASFSVSITQQSSSLSATSSSLAASLTTTNGTMVNNSASFATTTTNLSTTQTNNSASLASSITTTNNSLSTTSSSLASRITTLSSNTSTDSASFASRITTDVTALTTVSGAFSTTTTNQATAYTGYSSSLASSITSTNLTVSNNSASFATRTTTVEGRVTTDSSSFASRATTDESTISTNSSSFASRSTTIESTVTNNSSSMAARVSTDETAITNNSSSFASRITTVSASNATTSAAVTTEAAARASADGSLSAEYVLNVTAGNRVAGFRVTNLGGGGGGSAFVVQADQFKIYNTTTAGISTQVFLSDSSGVYMDQAYIRQLDANKINAVSLSAITANLGTVTAGAVLLGSGQDQTLIQTALISQGCWFVNKANGTGGTVNGYTYMGLTSGYTGNPGYGGNGDMMRYWSGINSTDAVNFVGMSNAGTWYHYQGRRGTEVGQCWGAWSYSPSMQYASLRSIAYGTSGTPPTIGSPGNSNNNNWFQVGDIYIQYT